MNDLQRMRRRRILWLALCSGISILWGYSLERTSPASMADFKAIYYGSRCLIQHHDPYKESEFLAEYRADSGEFPSDPGMLNLFLRAVPLCINLPTSLVLAVPLALLPWSSAHLVWMSLITISLVLAGILAWELAADYAPGAALLLVCILLANSELLLMNGNLAGIAVSLCVVALWCFSRERFILTGMLCLSIGLATKPQDAGPIWLYLLLSRPHRRRALWSSATTLALALGAVFWVARFAPHWLPELRANILSTSTRGDLSDPGPASLSGKGPEMIIDLQAAVSVFKDDPGFYDLVSYSVCGALAVLWAIKTLRSRFSANSPWLALATIVPITLLVTYHRPYDAKLLLLAIPACATLWAEGTKTGRSAFLVTTLAILATSDIPLVLLIELAKHFHVEPIGLTGKLLTVALTRPASLALLVMAVFYLWIYVRRVGDQSIARAVTP